METRPSGGAAMAKAFNLASRFAGAVFMPRAGINSLEYASAWATVPHEELRLLPGFFAMSDLETLRALQGRTHDDKARARILGRSEAIKRRLQREPLERAPVPEIRGMSDLDILLGRQGEGRHYPVYDGIAGTVTAAIVLLLVAAIALLAL